MTQTCVHCVAQRVLRREAGRLAARGLRIEISQTAPVRLPESGALIYRRLSRLLREVVSLADAHSTVKLALLHDLAGKSHVEVAASFSANGEWQQRSCLLPRYVLDTLWLGLGGYVAADS
jgi:hypothetical protein